MFESLNKYKANGSFTFCLKDSYSKCCNAPSNQSGVYLIFEVVTGKEILLYIGSSGQRDEDGKLKHRKGGIKDRLINGYHPHRFGEDKRIKRSKAFPKQMHNAKIATIKVYWWVTYDAENFDFPTDIESKLRDEYLLSHKFMPKWHKM